MSERRKNYTWNSDEMTIALLPAMARVVTLTLMLQYMSFYVISECSVIATSSENAKIKLR